MGLILQEISTIPTNPIYPVHDSVLDHRYICLDWDIEYGSSNSVKFKAPLERADRLKKGAWYKAYSDYDNLHPVAIIQIIAINAIKNNPCQDDCYYYEIEGITHDPSLSDNGIYVIFNTNRIKFIDLIRKYLIELNIKSRGLYSLDDRFVEDYNYYFDLFKFKNYAIEFLNHLSSLGFVSWWDADHRLHIHHENTHYQYIYGIITNISSNIITLDNTSFIRPDLPIELVARVNGIDTVLQTITLQQPYDNNILANTININELVNYQANLYIRQYQPNFIEFNLDKHKANTIQPASSSEAPSTQFIIKADNVLSSDWSDPELFYQANNNNGLSGLNLGSLQVTYRPQVFTLSGKPAEPRLYQEDMIGNLDLLDIASINASDSFINGRLIVNNITGSLFNTNYRNFKNDFDSDNGLLIGGSIQIHQRLGNIALLGLQLSPSDLPNQWIAGFVIDDTELKVVINGQVYSTGFDLIPTTEQAIVAFTTNTITVANGSLYEIGQDIYFTDLVGNSVGTGQIINISGNIITFDEIIGNLQAGYNALQVADYIVKYSYVKDNIIFYAKKGTDTKFTKLYDGNLITSRNAFIQLYANREHSISFDFVDIVDSFNIKACRLSPNTYYTSTCGASALSAKTDYITTRIYDIAFADQASRLQADLQVYEEDGKYKVQLPILDNSDEFAEDYYIIEAVLTANSFQLFDIGTLAVGDRMLFDGDLAYVHSIDTINRIITVDRPLPDANLESFVLRSDVHLANDEILCVEYKQIISLTMPICPRCCSEGLEISSRIESINVSERMTYDELRALAQDQIDKSCCDAKYEGMISYDIKHSNNIITCDDYRQWWDKAHKGQHLLIKSSCNIELNNKYIVMDNVRYIEGLEGCYKVEINLGPDSMSQFVNEILKIKNLAEGKAILINDDIPDQDLMCSLVDKINIEDNIINLYNFRSCNPTISGLLHAGISGGVCSKYQDIGLSLLDIITRSRISSTAVSGDVVNIWH